MIARQEEDYIIPLLNNYFTNIVSTIKKYELEDDEIYISKQDLGNFFDKYIYEDIGDVRYINTVKYLLSFIILPQKKSAHESWILRLLLSSSDLVQTLSLHKLILLYLLINVNDFLIICE